MDLRGFALHYNLKTSRHQHLRERCGAFPSGYRPTCPESYVSTPISEPAIPIYLLAQLFQTHPLIPIYLLSQLFQTRVCALPFRAFPCNCARGCIIVGAFLIATMLTNLWGSSLQGWCLGPGRL